MPIGAVKKSYRGVLKIVGRYWNIYGGHKAIFRSPFFHLSFVLAILTANIWIYGKWWEDVTSILPNLLGFTLGGFAIFLGFGDEKFKGEIAGNDPDESSEHSPYLGVIDSARIIHEL